MEVKKRINELTTEELEKTSTWNLYIYATKVIEGKLPDKCHNRMIQNLDDSYAKSYLQFLENKKKKNLWKWALSKIKLVQN